MVFPENGKYPNKVCSKFYISNANEANLMVIEGSEWRVKENADKNVMVDLALTNWGAREARWAGFDMLTKNYCD